MANELTVKKDLEQSLTALAEGAGMTPEEMAEELGGDIPEYPRIKIPSGGGIAFEIPSDDPDNPDVCKSIRGVVVHHHKANAYWEDSASTGNPPDCTSLDGITGYGKIGGPCADCPLNQFGSGEGGEGKACKNTERLYILLPDRLLPVVLSLPPTSLRNWKTYKTNVISKGKRICDLFTEISLSKESNAAGQDYSVATFRMGAPLSPELAGRSYQYRQGIKETIASGALAAREAMAPKIDAETGEVI